MLTAPAFATLAGKVELVLVTQRHDLSPALLAAQRRLKLLQKRFQEERATYCQSFSANADGRSLQPESPSLPEAQHPLTAVSDLPDHLGWESTPLTAALRAACQRRDRDHETVGYRQQATGDQRRATGEGRPATGDRQRATGFVDGVGQRTVSQRTSSTCEISSNTDVKLHPDIALAMLRQGQAAAGRVWLLLQHLDGSGCGWVRIDEARKRLTNKKSGMFVCGWRQLRNLLTQGENIFWQRQNERIWLRSTAKVAASLGVWHLQHRPVVLPLTILKQPIGTIRAHFYASFHSGRSKISNTGREQPQPIARNTIAEITDVNPRTQRIYEKKANVHKQCNFALGEKATAEQEQERAWRQGRALFRLTDHSGKQGKPGTAYLAWQLPNNYIGPHNQRPRGQQKRLNQKLTDLFRKGKTGNGQKTVKESGERRPRRFYGNGRLAAKAYNSGNWDIYWRSCQRLGQRDHYRLWYSLPQMKR